MPKKHFPQTRTIHSLSLIFTVFIVLIIFNGCSGPPKSEAGTDDTPQAQQPLAVEVLEVSKGPLITRITGSGTISGTSEAMVVSQTQGIIEQVSFELGRKVAKGETLVQVDSEIARLNMEQANEQLENARIDYQTKQRLVEQGGASRAEVLRARSTLRGAEARYKQTQKLFEDSSITAPISGYIAEKQQAASLGNYLSPGMRIARISDLSSLHLETAVGEGMIGLVREGAAATITIPAACEDKVFNGRVVAVAAGISPDTGSYRVIIEWENSCGPDIKSGMSAEASIVPATGDPVIVIPSSIPLFRDGKTVVFTASDGVALQKEITTGRRVGNRIEIISGLETGEKLIISGITRLSPDRKITATTVGETGSVQ